MLRTFPFDNYTAPPYQAWPVHGLREAGSNNWPVRNSLFLVVTPYLINIGAENKT